MNDLFIKLEFHLYIYNASFLCVMYMYINTSYDYFTKKIKETLSVCTTLMYMKELQYKQVHVNGGNISTRVVNFLPFSFLLNLPPQAKFRLVLK